MSGKMALKGSVLATLVYDAMAEADKASAEGAKVVSADGAAIAVDTETPQKQLERKGTADAIALTIIDYLVNNTEVIIPDHPSTVAMTGVGGGPPHVHPTNQTPISHIIGRIE